MDKEAERERYPEARHTNTEQGSRTERREREACNYELRRIMR